MKDIERIKEMEKILDDNTKIVSKLNDYLESFKKNMNDIRRLEEYYGSSEWFEDKEKYEQGKIDKKVKAGVLSEDAIYDLLTDVDGIIRMCQEIGRE